MDSFDRVFFVVKKECEKQKKFAEVYPLDIIAKDCDIPLTKLGLYLGHLQDLGLLKYSIADKYVYLTSLGKKRVENPAGAKDAMAEKTPA
jgi:hypothetical protein